jgi:fatty-acid peroxygenase
MGYGTNHDARTWDAPEQFRPERFLQIAEDHYSFVAQGVGRYDKDHRCPGEPLTVAVMSEAARFVIEEMDYDVPDQDLGIQFDRLPALPRSRMVIRGVRIKARASTASLP